MYGRIFIIGGLKRGVIGMRAPSVQFLSFSCIFPQKPFQIIGFRQKPRSWYPLSRLGNPGSATVQDDRVSTCKNEKVFICF